MTMNSQTVASASAAPRPIGRLAAWARTDIAGFISAVYLVALGVICLLAPWISPYSPTAQDYDYILSPPSGVHWLGTDDLGRDMFSRLLNGAPATIGASLLAVSVAIVLGIPIGLFAGTASRWADAVVSRVIDTLLSFPGIVLAVAVTGMLGIGLVNAMTAMGIVFAPVLARLMRAQTLIVRESLHVEAARMFGASPLRILVHHILPNAVQPVIVQITLLLSVGLLAESSLSFMGLGVQPPNPSWGAMLARSYSYIESAPEQIILPGLAIITTSLAFARLGESLRVALDPAMRGR